MLITNKLNTTPAGGREMLCKLNYDLLLSIFDANLVLFEVERGRRLGLLSAINAFRGYIDGLNLKIIDQIIKTIQEEKIKKVFIDGSNFGEIVNKIKVRCPQVEIITFFHNVEARFFLGSLRIEKNMRALAVLIANFLSERKSVKFSNKIICLSNRDSRLLKKIYGRFATHISPMALQDKVPPVQFNKRSESSEKFALFVGGVFYANLIGIKWFIVHVVPRISIKICIVGRGFETLRNQLEIKGKVEVVGEVNNLENWYRDADFVIAPIFDGSGMKTKVAEALKYGKVIIGTPEAFSGYEQHAMIAGSICKSPDEFVEAIENSEKIVQRTSPAELRRIFETNYSFEAAKDRLKIIMEA